MNVVESTQLINKVDPFRCINYRIFIKNKIKLNLNDLNRNPKKLVVLTVGNKFNDTFNLNKLTIPRCNGKNYSKLFDLLHFLNNLYLMNLEYFRPTILSYKDKDFFKTFESIQRMLFK